MILEKRIPLRYLFNLAKVDLLIVLLVSSAMTFVTNYFNIEYDFPISIPAFLGTAITLVLSFKLNQSYDRWWEARKIWGAIVNDSRSLIVQLIEFTDEPENKLVREIGQLQIAWCYSLANALRKLPPAQQAEDLIPDSEWSKIVKQDNIPLGIHVAIAKRVNQLRAEDKLNAYQQVQIDETLVRLTASMGMAERIKNTVFPKKYRLFLHFFIYIFIGTLDIAITGLIHTIFEVPLVVIIALPFFMLEKTALGLQDPFENRPNDTAMSTISTAIDRNIRQLLDLPGQPDPLESDSFYAM
ncbi:bestrophin family protein [Aureitalea marina]|uniref:Bestrophin n=1 Tax=Aureitalea marina TaxID=930804 RepID=A0A2S7KNA6_9FLAO|nr:bestrophin family ion channel [Aureitalea marina]PQB04091.1 hypothetical protein BST85_03630 [Aureitalea marina]